jgi:hypothetical protein
VIRCHLVEPFVSQMERLESMELSLISGGLRSPKTEKMAGMSWTVGSCLYGRRP